MDQSLTSRRNEPVEIMKTPRPCAAVTELLERRRLFSATLNSGMLTVTGTEASNRITVAVDRRFINVIDVAVDSELHRFALGSFSYVNIDGLGGNDRILVDSSLDLLSLTTNINGGAGNDTITTGVGNDYILGGNGNDKITTGAGNDRVAGEAGNDSLIVGDG